MGKSMKIHGFRGSLQRIHFLLRRNRCCRGKSSVPTSWSDACSSPAARCGSTKSPRVSGGGFWVDRFTILWLSTLLSILSTILLTILVTIWLCTSTDYDIMYIHWLWYYVHPLIMIMDVLWLHYIYYIYNDMDYDYDMDNRLCTSTDMDYDMDYRYRWYGLYIYI